MNVTSLFSDHASAVSTAWRRAAVRQRVAILSVLALYSALLAYMIPRHEPWADEAQAWELAKTLSLKDLFHTYIHYEVSPGLWHTFLWALARMHVTYNGMHWIVAAIALLAMVLLTVASPFPLLLRLALPFTYFFAYQYSLVARSYVLFPLLLFALACIWQRRRESPLLVALLIGLLANAAAHGLAIALGLAVVLAAEWWSVRREEGRRFKRWTVAAVLLLVLLGVAAWCLLPPPDADWVKNMHDINHNPASFAAVADGLTRRLPWLRVFPLWMEPLLALICSFPSLIGVGLSDRFYLGLISWILLVWLWSRTGQLRYVLPVLFLAILCLVSRFNVYHAGLFWVLFLFLFWVTWPERDLPQVYWLKNAILTVLVLCVAIQLRWTVHAVRYDAVKSYSADRDGAVILQDYLNHGLKVDVAVPRRFGTPQHGEFFVTGLEPYFAKEPIQNMRSRFWIWSADDTMRAQYLRDTQNRAVAVIVEESPDDRRFLGEEARLDSLGYRRDKIVCGQAFYPHKMGPLLCHVFYKPY